MTTAMRQRLLLQILAFASLLLLLFTYLDWASLHDISVDYVSLKILKDLGITLSEPPPEWVNTPGEWSIVRIALVARIVFFLLNAIILIKVVTSWPQKKAANPAA